MDHSSLPQHTQKSGGLAASADANHFDSNYVGPRARKHRILARFENWIRVRCFSWIDLGSMQFSLVEIVLCPKFCFTLQRCRSVWVSLTLHSIYRRQKFGEWSRVIYSEK
jgi:hypothetical protein